MFSLAMSVCLSARSLTKFEWIPMKFIIRKVGHDQEESD